MRRRSARLRRVALSATFVALTVGLTGVLAGGASGRTAAEPACTPTPRGGNFCVLGNPSVNRASLDLSAGGTRLFVQNNLIVNRSGTAVAAQNGTSCTVVAGGDVGFYGTGGTGTPDGTGTTCGRTNDSGGVPWCAHDVQPTCPDDRPTTLTTPAADPFASEPEPPPDPSTGVMTQAAACALPAGPMPVSGTVSPGVYTSLNKDNTLTLTLQPGVYTIQNFMQIRGGASGRTLGNGVTLYFCPQAGAGRSNIFTKGGQNSVSLTAPGGATGFAIFVARNNTNSGNVLDFRGGTGGTFFNITGRVYGRNTNFYANITCSEGSQFMHGDVVVGTAQVVSSACLHIVEAPLGEGFLKVRKTIDGDAAGRQGKIVITVECGEESPKTFEIAADAGPGPHESDPFGPFEEGTKCTVTETQDGAGGSIGVMTVPSEPQVVEIPGGDATKTVSITDTYTEALPAEGWLKVVKTATGEAAGHQGKVVIKVTCGEVPQRTFVVRAGAAGGTSQNREYGPFPEGTTCTIDEVHDGHTTQIDVDTTPKPFPEEVEIPANDTKQVDIKNTFTWIPGSLRVRKTIQGGAVAAHGKITIHVRCGEQDLEPFVIETGMGTDSKGYDGIPAGTLCTVTETPDGSTDTVECRVTGDPEVTIPANDVGEIHLTNTCENRVPPPPGRGSLTVTKTITGPAHAEHGDIHIQVTCEDEEGQFFPLEPFKIPAGHGTDSRTYHDIPAPSTCSVVELVDGSTDSVRVEIAGNQTAHITDGGLAHIDLKDTYEHIVPGHGSLRVIKRVTGPAAAHHGLIRLEVVCGEQRRHDFVIPPGAGSRSHAYGNIPAGTICRVTEIQDGSTTTVHVLVAGGREATISGGSTSDIELTDTYTTVTPPTGSLTVTKTITGPAAGRQGPVTIGVTCGGSAQPDFTIPAGAPAGSSSRTYTGIAAGTTCIVLERVDGRTSTVAVAVTGSGATTVVPAGGTATLALTDSYSSDPDSLVVNKTITGLAAGQQGAVTIQVSCNGTALPAFTIPAGAAAGTTSHTFSGLTAGATCTLSEVADGHTSTVGVTVTGDRQAIISGSGAATATLVDTYTGTPGTLTVHKTIAGEGAGSQGPVRIGVTCGGVPQPDFVVAAGKGAGTVSHTYTGLAAGSQCTVTEAADGHTSSVDVTVTGNSHTVTIPAGGTATVALRDRYTRISGSLTVQKTIAGLGVANQKRITIRVSCSGRRLPNFVIPARTGPATVSRTYHGLNPGARCTVTEPPAHAKRVTFERRSGRHATVQANRHVTIQLTDTYLAAAVKRPAHRPRPHHPRPKFTG